MTCQRLNSYRVAGWNTAVCLASLFVASGCQTMNTELGHPFTDVPPAAEAAAASPSATPVADVPKFYLELRADGRKPEVIAMPLSGDLFIQQALDQSGASRRFGRMKIELYRKLPEGGGHKFDIAYDRAKRQIPAGSDYAIYPKDRIIVTEDTSNMFDDMLSSLGVNFRNY